MKDILLPRSKITIVFDSRDNPTIESLAEQYGSSPAVDVLESFLLAMVVELSQRRMFSTHRTELINVLDEALLTAIDGVSNFVAA